MLLGLEHLQRVVPKLPCSIKKVSFIGTGGFSFLPFVDLSCCFLSPHWAPPPSSKAREMWLFQVGSDSLSTEEASASQTRTTGGRHRVAHSTLCCAGSQNCPQRENPVNSTDQIRSWTFCDCGGSGLASSFLASRGSAPNTHQPNIPRFENPLAPNKHPSPQGIGSSRGRPRQGLSQKGRERRIQLLAKGSLS